MIASPLMPAPPMPTKCSRRELQSALLKARPRLSEALDGRLERAGLLDHGHHPLDHTFVAGSENLGEGTGDQSIVPFAAISTTLV